MGLDQYAFSVYKKGSEEASEEIAYWRKHNALHGWMQKLYISKGGKGDMEYGPLELSSGDVKSLGYDVENDLLPETQGFFFGHDSRFDEHKKEITLSFVDTAESKIADGQKIFYSCSW